LVYAICPPSRIQKTAPGFENWISSVPLDN